MKRKMILLFMATSMVAAGCGSSNEKVNTNATASVEAEVSVSIESDASVGTESVVDISSEEVVLEESVATSGTESGENTLNTFEDTVAFMKANSIESIIITEQDLKETDDYYELSVVLTERVQVPVDLKVGETITIETVDYEFNTIKVEITKTNDTEFSVDGEELYMIYPEEANGSMIDLHYCTDEYVTTCLKRGIIRVKKDANVKIDIEKTCETVTKEDLVADELFNCSYNGFEVDQDGYITELVYYGA